ncbi:MAG: hypothetical protein ROM03_07695 [Mucispirillum sp.]|nr:hypothetical protein [Mucispirillum sp.]
MALTLTKAGKSLLQKIQVGEIEVIDFTGIAVGSGRWNTEDINDNISALKEMKIKNGLSNKQTEVRDNETIVTISATLNNKEIEEAFYVYEVGLYAMDGDEEVLYAFDITPSNEIAQAVVQANTVPQYIPVILDTALSSIDKVNIKITADVGFVSADQFENYKQDIKRQLDGKQPAGDYATTEALTSGLSNKSDKNHNHDEEYLKQEKATELFAEKSHNHDDAYSKANHTHTGYAASSHSHAFSAITGSMAITDKRLTGNLPISRVSGALGELKVTVADGVTWIETPLNNGKSLLYGIAKKTPTGDGITELLWKMIPIKIIDDSTVKFTANYLSISSSENIYTELYVNTYGDLYTGGYKNILVQEKNTENKYIKPTKNFLLTMQAITR